MSEFLLLAALFVLATIALGLVGACIGARAPCGSHRQRPADRKPGGVAVTLLLAGASGEAAINRCGPGACLARRLRGRRLRESPRVRTAPAIPRKATKDDPGRRPHDPVGQPGPGLSLPGPARWALLRFPDFHTRLHALTKADNLGLGLDRGRCRFPDRGPVRRYQARLVWLLAVFAAASRRRQLIRAQRACPPAGRQ